MLLEQFTLIFLFYLFMQLFFFTEAKATASVASMEATPLGIFKPVL
jgi:hypothetical protein